MTSLLSRRLARLVVGSMLPLLTVGLGPARAVAEDDSTPAAAACQLQDGEIKHVISITFDNTHFTRDNPNVPSDLEFMPNLLNFMKENGTLLTNYHTPLISHTATDILTSLTGVYGDRHGVPVSNSFRYFIPGDPAGRTSLGVSFAYWTAPLFDPTSAAGKDMKYNMLTADGKNAPAPWVPFTRAGCDFGAVSTANIVLENIAIDIPTVFGAGSPEAAEATSPNKANRDRAFANYVGIAVHCARDSSLCSAAHNGKADKLPDEPGGYQGYNGLFGHKYVAPQVSADGLVRDLNGNLIQNVKTGTAYNGFPGFDSMPAAVSLGYVAAMQEHGIPVTYAYITDSHDKKTLDDQEYSYGPGEAGYVANLKANDEAFGKFFARLKDHGIDKSNTLFLFTADEGDHFAGVQKTGCDGVTVYCTYRRDTVKEVGEVNGNLAGLLKTQKDISTPFTVHADVAPTVYITGNPARDNASTRAVERATGGLKTTNPYTGVTENLTEALADPVEMKLLHMVTADPARTPTFTMFALPDYFLFAGAPNCTAPCISIVPKFAWNHGTFSPDITTTWLGLVGPGVRAKGIDHTTWSDHADLRPTTLSLLGLRDDYSHQGRVLVETFNEDSVPENIQSEEFLNLARAYKQINAPIGQLSLDSLKISTRAVNGNDATYNDLTARLADITNRRDALAGQMETLLEAAAFSGEGIDGDQARSLIEQAHDLLDEVRELAGQGQGDAQSQD
jgi:hypothetical protein